MAVTVVLSGPAGVFGVGLYGSGALMPDDVPGVVLTHPQMVDWQPVVAAPDSVGPATVVAVLQALAAMARNSRRHEADVGSALQGAGLVLEAAQLDAALQQLLEAECIERIIPLTDGGRLVSVTGTGMSRASGGG